MSGVLPNVHGALSLAMESQDVVTAAPVALDMLELDAEPSAVLSALTDCEGVDVVTSAGGDRGFESWRKFAQKQTPVHGGTCTKSLD